MHNTSSYNRDLLMRARLNTVFLAAILLALNLWVVKELLTAEFIDQMYSIEGTHIAISRFALEHWPDLSWFPLWYGGVPYQNAYPPLHPLLVAAAARLFGLSPALAYHATTAVFYSLGPVTLFLLALHLSKSRAYSFLAAGLYSLTSPSAFLIPIVRQDMGSPWHARRLQALVHYGEGPHIAAMTFVPLAVLLLIIAFEKRRALWWFLASIAAAGVFLTNWIGAFVLALAVAAWLVSRDGRLDPRHWLAAAAVGAYTYLICCSWMPPSTIQTVQRDEMLNGGAVSGPASRFACAALAAPALLILLFLVRRYKTPSALRFALLFLFPMAWLTLASQWFGVAVLPQAHRFQLEMEMGIVLTAAFGAKLILDAVRPRARVAIACVLLLVAVYPAVKYRRYAERLTRHIDVRKTIEYREAQWFAANVKGGRVFAPGSAGFYLNAFTGVPQFSGGFYQGVVNPAYFHFFYQITTGENAGAAEGEVAALALRAFGVDAIGVSGAGSREIFKDFRNPKKFDGVLPEAWRDGNDVIYLVPRRSSSLAHVVRPGDLPARQPKNGLDIDPIRQYTHALEDPSLPLAAMVWRNPHAAAISAPLEPGQVLSVQISYHPGWHATVNGQRRRIFGDNLGQLAIEPACEGPCTVELNFDGGTEMLVARVVSWSALLAGIGWVLVNWRRRVPRSVHGETMSANIGCA